jgi:hypothetical protein
LNPSELFQITTDVFGDAFGYLTDVTGLTQKCSFIEDPVAVLADMLPNYIRGQDQGIAAIINGFAAWQFSRQSGYPNPLVLAITGPTGKISVFVSMSADLALYLIEGVGKSETSRLIAEAILARRVRIGNTQRSLLVSLSGLLDHPYPLDSTLSAILSYLEENFQLPLMHTQVVALLKSVSDYFFYLNPLSLRFIDD